MRSRSARADAATTLRPLALALVGAVAVLGSASGWAAECPRACAGEVAACRRSTCGGLGGRERHRCIRACRAQSTCTAPGVRLRTLAYVTSVCEEVPGGGITFRQRLLVRRGNCAPVTLLEFPLVGPVPDPAGVCRILGGFRNGFGSVGVGIVQRFSVLPDGSALVVELNNDHSLYPPAAPEAAEEGIFLVQADGSGMRRLGAASRRPLLITQGSSFLLNDNAFFSVSPNGRTIAFSDLIPGPDGAESRVLVTIDVPTGRRTELTGIPGPVYGSTFLGNDRLFIYAREPPLGYTVKPNGTELRELPPVVAIEGSRVQPIFGLAGGGGDVVQIVLPEKADRTYGGSTNIVESFLVDGDDVLQLTNYRYPDTFAVSGRDRVFVAASADPLGTNPTRDCQLFSVGRLGGGLRQLTAFADGVGQMRVGCNAATPPGAACTVIGMIQDPVTGVVGFVSSCDPLGRNPYGFQVFAMRPDGTGLRQVTDARGMETLPDGRVRVELPGPISYSALPAR